MKTIEMADGTGNKALVDDADFDWLSKYIWVTVGIGTQGKFCPETIIDGKHWTMHKLIMDRPNNPVFHKNENSWDDQRNNMKSSPYRTEIPMTRGKNHKAQAAEMFRLKQEAEASVSAKPSTAHRDEDIMMCLGKPPEDWPPSILQNPKYSNIYKLIKKIQDLERQVRDLELKYAELEGEKLQVDLFNEQLLDKLLK